MADDKVVKMHSQQPDLESANLEYIEIMVHGGRITKISPGSPQAIIAMEASNKEDAVAPGLNQLAEVGFRPLNIVISGGTQGHVTGVSYVMFMVREAE